MEKAATVAGKTPGRIDIAKLYLTTLVQGFKAKGLFDDIQTYCMFLGYPRSGHTLVGSLLDAHPDVIIGHGVDALQYLKMGFGKEQIFYLLLENSRMAAETGRTNNRSRYSFAVPHQWQGKFRKLRVIGDKRGGRSTSALHSNPHLLQDLRRTVGVKVKFTHVIRNPYDNIATISRKRLGKDLQSSIVDYLSLCRKMDGIKTRLDSSDILDVRHEALIENPEGCLATCCRFLEIDAPRDYLADCASIVYKAPHHSRHDVDWTAEMIEAVAQIINTHSFLEGYTF